MVHEHSKDPATAISQKRSVSIWPAVGCSVAAGVNIITGLVWKDRAFGWRNDEVAGDILVIGALALVPPILQTIRARFPQTKPRWIPVVYALALIPFATLVSQPLSPTPAERVRLRTGAVQQATALLAHGQLDEAAITLDRYRSDHDVAVDQLVAQVGAKKAALASAAAPTPVSSQIPEVHEPLQSAGSAYAERVRTYWLPAVHALPDSAPADDDAYKKMLLQLDGLLQDVAEGADLELTTDEQAARHELVHALSKKQLALFPSLRRRYVTLLRAKLFRDDIDVSISGPGGTTLRQIGPMFIQNANIQDNQQASLPIVNRARFHREEYRWGHYLPGGYTYTYHAPGDGDVMVWHDGTNEWTPVKK